MAENKDFGSIDQEDAEKDVGAKNFEMQEFRKWLDTVDRFEDLMFSGKIGEARELQQKCDIGDYDRSDIPAAAFEGCLQRGDQGIEIAFNITKEFKVPKEVIEERVDYFVMRGLVQGYAGLIFPLFEKYFSISNGRKKKIVLKAIEECGHKRKAEEIKGLFSELLE